MVPVPSCLHLLLRVTCFVAWGAGGAREVSWGSSTDQESSQTCCLGGSQACIQAFSWRAGSSGPCCACVALQSQVLTPEEVAHRACLLQQAVSGSFCGSCALVFASSATCYMFCCMGGGGSKGSVTLDMFSWGCEVPVEFNTHEASPKADCKFSHSNFTSVCEKQSH